METNYIFFLFKTGKRWHECPPTQPYTNKQAQKYDSFDNLHSMNHLAQTEVFSHQSFVYVFSQSAQQHEGSFVVGLCVGKECDKDFKGLDKSTLSFGQSPVIQQRARAGGGAVGSSPQKTHPVISSTPEQLFPQLRSRHTHRNIDTNRHTNRSMHNGHLDDYTLVLIAKQSRTTVSSKIHKVTRKYTHKEKHLFLLRVWDILSVSVSNSKPTL